MQTRFQAAGQRGQSGAEMTSGQVPVPRVLERCRRDTHFGARAEVVGRVVDQHVDPELHATGDLVVGAVQVVVREADLLQPLGRLGVGVRGPVARDVDEVALLVPARDGLDRARVGLRVEHALRAVGLVDDRLQLLGRSASIAHVDCVS